MGFGDEIMASGHARVESERLGGGKIHILGTNHRARNHEVWWDLPWIAVKDEKSVGSVHNASGCRPYITYPFTIHTGCTYSGWRARDYMGAIYLRGYEVDHARSLVGHLGQFALVEPELKEGSNPNKQWGLLKWGRLTDMLVKAMPVVQTLMPGKKALPGVIGIRCDTFRIAAAVLSLAHVLVLPEGGLHHAAAVLGKPAVVLFGGSPSPEYTGYPIHTNIAADKHCGAWLPCKHCAQFWDGLTPEYVYSTIKV